MNLLYLPVLCVHFVIFRFYVVRICILQHSLLFVAYILMDIHKKRRVNFKFYTANRQKKFISKRKQHELVFLSFDHIYVGFLRSKIFFCFGQKFAEIGSILNLLAYQENRQDSFCVFSMRLNTFCVFFEYQENLSFFYFDSPVGLEKLQFFFLL